MKDLDIVFIGSAILDSIIKGFDPNPVSSAGYRAESGTLNAGGEAVNGSIAASKLGMKTAILCSLGNDDAGGIIEADLKKHGENLNNIAGGMAIAVEDRLKSERMKTELITNVSHDIKTPVASIKALGELLEAQSTDPKSKERLGSIVTKADNIDAMVSDLFTETLTELNELNVETSEQESRILDRIIKDADHMDLVTGGKVEGCIIMCDPLRVTQVVNNIIFNSYKYAGTKIHLESHIEDDYLVVSFTDEGGGVSNDEIPMITKRFRRGENAKGKPGSGLGLAIAYELMEKMGGDLEVANADKGLRVRLFFKIV